MKLLHKKEKLSTDELQSYRRIYGDPCVLLYVVSIMYITKNVHKYGVRLISMKTRSTWCVGGTWTYTSPGRRKHISNPADHFTPIACREAYLLVVLHKHWWPIRGRQYTAKRGAADAQL